MPKIIIFYLSNVQKKYVILVVFFGILLLTPFGVQAIDDIRGEKRFVSLDIFKDVVYTPFVRESNMAAGAARLDSAWREARESIAGGTETADALEPVIGALSDLEAVALTVNAYARAPACSANGWNSRWSTATGSPPASGWSARFTTISCSARR